MSMTTETNGANGEITATKQQRLIIKDDSEFSLLIDTGRFEQAWRVAKLYSDSDLVPTHFRGKPANCFIAIQMATRLGIDPFMMIQNTYVVHGKPGMEAKLAIALINKSGLFTDALDYEISGEDPTNKNYKVRAFAVRKSTGKTVYGPWVNWPMVEAEGWSKKDGSKWKTIPGIMFQYRAATFFGRLHCPERLMGMQTADELLDVQDEIVEGEYTVNNAQAKLEEIKKKSKAAQNAPVQEEPAQNTATPPQQNQDDSNSKDVILDDIRQTMESYLGDDPKLISDTIKKIFGVNGMAQLARLEGPALLEGYGKLKAYLDSLENA